MLSKIKNVKNKLNCKMCYTMPKEIIPNLSWEKYNNLTHRKRLNIYLRSALHIEENVPFIPKQYFTQKTSTVADNLYLVDCRIAKDIVKNILPLMQRTNQIICETNSGLGFIAGELLSNGLQRIRLYETCPDFRLTLKGFDKVYPGQVELFVKDFFQIWKMSYMDKYDKGDRITQFLKGVSKREWSDDPVMTIIGCMPKLDFISYMFKMISLQNEIVQYGRIELFVLMRPGDYLKLTAGPECDLHTYQPISVFANLFCKFKILEKYPRIAFLPWESNHTIVRARSFRKYELDKIYLVHIKFKEQLPLKNDQLLPFHFFVKNLFGRGTVPVIKKMEEWIDGIGQQIILLELKKDMSIFTKSGEFVPSDFLKFFNSFYDHPEYESDSLTSLVKAKLLKNETVETDVANMQNSSKRL